MLTVEGTCSCLGPPGNSVPACKLVMAAFMGSRCAYSKTGCTLEQHRPPSLLQQNKGNSCVDVLCVMRIRSRPAGTGSTTGVRPVTVLLVDCGSPSAAQHIMCDCHGRLSLSAILTCRAADCGCACGGCNTSSVRLCAPACKALYVFLERMQGL